MGFLPLALLASAGLNKSGQQAFTSPGLHTFTVPFGVTSVSVVCVGGGGGGAINQYQDSKVASGGAALAYGNNIPVTGGESINVTVGAGGSLPDIAGGASWFKSSSILQAGGSDRRSRGTGSGTARSGGGSGGLPGYGFTIAGNKGGGGAGGYSGNGGAGGLTDQGTKTPTAGSGGGGGGGGVGDGGGGVGILGEGTSGTAGNNSGTPGGGGSGGNAGSTGGNGGNFGGGAGGASGATGGGGAVRIIWGNGRAFPSTNTGDV